MSEISAVDAVALATQGAWLLDVREPHEWAIGRSPLATSIPMSQLNERLIEVPEKRQILVVCHAGSRSLRVTDALQAAGYDAVNVAGGMVAWERAGGVLVADGVEPPRVD